jgi:hypothetical protein
MKINLNDLLPVEYLTEVTAFEVASKALYQGTARAFMLKRTRWCDLTNGQMVDALTFAPKWTKALLNAGVKDRRILADAITTAVWHTKMDIVLLLAKADALGRGDVIVTLRDCVHFALAHEGVETAKQLVKMIERLENTQEK